MVSLREWAETDYWISNPEHRKERQQKIHSATHICPRCDREMRWNSDHLTFIWFECTAKGCNGESKAYL
ncbi:hypothetical protein ANTHOS_220 [Bacillus phage Anthos]|uniref:Uncharacterized protein n=2 Tax=Caudoviricetes TaxID=2731619 RepID=A0A7U3T8V1_9CAUD|nr:hypothetical protein BEYONPHE_236 [Bacillus phage Beyonphe]QPY77456.1 hypothetical protein ANTHOS_220 [Bacillus phage Anthos]